MRSLHIAAAAACAQVFKLFDTEGKGGISLADLKRVAKELGEGMTGECVECELQHTEGTTGARHGGVCVRCSQYCGFE